MSGKITAVEKERPTLRTRYWQNSVVHHARKFGNQSKPDLHVRSNVRNKVNNPEGPYSTEETEEEEFQELTSLVGRTHIKDAIQLVRGCLRNSTAVERSQDAGGEVEEGEGSEKLL